MYLEDLELETTSTNCMQIDCPYYDFGLGGAYCDKTGGKQLMYGTCTEYPEYCKSKTQTKRIFSIRTRSERRKNDFKKAIRKKNICEKYQGFPAYKNLHQYSKNKIHCSCPLCSAKTDMNTKLGIKHSDRIKIDSTDSQIKELYEKVGSNCDEIR